MFYKSSRQSARITFAIFVCLLSSCGYHLQGSGSVLPDDIETVSIPTVENFSTIPGIGLTFTEKLRSTFERYGVVRVVEPNRGSDAILAAKITDIQFNTRDVTGTTDVVLQQQMVMTVSAELKRKNGQILWRNDQIRVVDAFASTSDVVVTSSADFSQAGIGATQLDSLGSREVSRGAQTAAMDGLLDEASRIIYTDAVAADF